MATKETTTDSVDRGISEWPSELQNIDLDIEAAVQRMQHIVKAIRGRMDETLAEFNLSYGEWGMLAHLTWGGSPYRSSPGRLAQKEGLSSGAMTNRLDRLEQAGLIQRLPDPDDRRALLVELTEKGHQLWLDALGAQASKEAAVAAALSRKELRELNALLRKVLLEFER
ncbi:MAG TPA: MarR family transcriptional regulator [Gaiellaceae bacterium]|nr:MarR family transcriptional regulator [Gaiellaceae bacterium]